MRIEAPKIGGGIGEVGLKGGLRTSLDFGPKLQSPTGIISSDRTVPQPGNVFREGFFETLAKPEKLSTGLSVAEIHSDRKVNLPKKPTSVFDFGSEHKVDPGSWVADRIPSRPASIFKEGIFETLAKPKRPDKPLSKPREVFDQKLFEVIAKPQDTPEVKMPVAKENFAVSVGPSVKTQEEDDQEKERKDKKQKKGKPLDVEAVRGEQTLWQILTGEIIPSANPVPNENKSKAKTDTQLMTKEESVEEESKVEVEPQPAIQLVNTLVNDQQGETVVSFGQGKLNDQEEPREPLWEVSGQKLAIEEIARDVLKRRMNVAQGVVETAAKGASEKKGKQWFLAKVTSGLGQIDIPTEEEFLRIIFGRLTFPLVAKEGEEKVKSLKPVEFHPTGVFKTLQEILTTSPPVKPKGGGMEYDGSLPQSRLEQVNNEAKVLAREGAEHIVYDPRIGKMKKVEEKPYRYPLELDKTKKTVPVEGPKLESRVIDRRRTPWYTLFAQRAEARAKKKAKS